MFTDDELFEILRILAVVLHLGNIQYTGKYRIKILMKISARVKCFFHLSAQSAKGIDSVTIKDPKLVEFIASLLEVRRTALT